jgi:flagellar biosynthesis protein FlhG
MTRFGDAERMGILSALDAVEDRFDLVLIDSSAGIHDNVLFFVGAAQECLLVVSPEPTSLSDAYAAVKSLSQRVGMQNFHVIVNTVANEEAARRVFDKLSQVTARFLTAQLRYLGHLPRDENLSRAVLLQRPAVEAFPRAPFCRALAQVGDALLAEPPPGPLSGGLKFLWQRLLRESAGGGV